MEKSFLDESTDLILESLKDAKGEISEMFKGARPYRQEPMPEEERIQNYMNLLRQPEMEQQLRTEMGDEHVDKIHSGMEELRQRRTRYV